MSKDVSFSLDQVAASVILTEMVAPVLKQSAEAIASRARSMAGSMTSNPPEITVTESVGVIKRGRRAIATITAVGDDAHANYIGHQVLAKAKDAGRV
jgi:hypothetical protein